MIYNPLDKFYKSKTGAVCENELITFRVKGNFGSVVFIFKNDNEENFTEKEMLKDNEIFSVSIAFSKGLYFYAFIADGKYISRSPDLLGEFSESLTLFQLSVYIKAYNPPNWIMGGIIYQIFPDRFNSSGENIDKTDRYIHKDKSETPFFLPNSEGKVLNNDFYGGDLKGIVQKIPYLKKLHISAIYLNPIFEAYSNHRYDTGDYFKIDPLLGDENDLKELIDIADKNGIKIILDGVFNHTGDDSVYFNKYNHYNSLGAYNGHNSPYYKWFKFNEYPDSYESWWGIETLPTLNKDCEEYLNFIAGDNGVISHYIDLGVYGIRLDVVDELPSHFVRRIRNAVKKVNGDAEIIGEVWEDASNKISYGIRREYFLGEELDSVMNYPLKDAIIDFVKNKDVSLLLRTVKEQIDHYPNSVLNSLMNILSTHDTYRIISALEVEDGLNLSKQEMSNYKILKERKALSELRLKIASLLQFTLYGVPSIYYGDEVGMEGLSDPFNRRYFPWGKENKEILSWYELLSDIRTKYDAFTCGEFCLEYAAESVLVYRRKGKTSDVLIAVNTDDRDCTLEFSEPLVSLIDGKVYSKFDLNTNKIGVFVKK